MVSEELIASSDFLKTLFCRVFICLYDKYVWGMLQRFGYPQIGGSNPSEAFFSEGLFPVFQFFLQQKTLFIRQNSKFLPKLRFF